MNGHIQELAAFREMERETETKKETER